MRANCGYRQIQLHLPGPTSTNMSAHHW
jgi:hypothetical protein